MRFLKQSTAFTFRIGPFVDSTDGVTAETGLSIAQADIQISKDGGAFAQTSASPTTTHDSDGWYQCPLTATDTGTLGPLTVQIVMTGALPVWEHFMVLPANVYDSLVDGSDNLQVDATQIEGADATDQIRDAVVDDATRIDASALNTASSAIGSDGTGLTEAGGDGDHLTEAGGTGDHLTAIPWNSAWDAEVESEVNDALDTAISELSQAIPTATPTIRTALMLMYMALRNKLVVQTSGTDAIEIYNDAGTMIAKKTISDDGSDYTEDEMTAGS